MSTALKPNFIERCFLTAALVGGAVLLAAAGYALLLMS